MVKTTNQSVFPLSQSVIAGRASWLLGSSPQGHQIILSDGLLFLHFLMFLLRLFVECKPSLFLDIQTQNAEIHTIPTIPTLPTIPTKHLLYLIGPKLMMHSPYAPNWHLNETSFLVLRWRGKKRRRSSMLQPRIYAKALKTIIRKNKFDQRWDK